MTNPYQTPVAAPEWPGWQTAQSGPWPAPQAAAATANWRTEATVATLATVYSVVLGAAVGLLWPRVAPHVQLVRAIDGSEAATKALLGDDLWLGLLGIVAGVLSVAVLAVVARDAGSGPGGLIGLTVGGVLGSLVAAQVGHLVQQPHIVASLHSSFPGITPRSVKTILGYFDFKVRAKAVLVAWPVAAVLLHAATGVIRYLRNP